MVSMGYPLLSTINHLMRGCRRHQPPHLNCPTCAGRTARRTARAILATDPRRLHGVKFSTHLTPKEFHSWRIAARNIIDHRRRQCRWWHGVQMQVWLGADGQVRGVGALGSITPEEFIEAFSRWQPTLRRIAPEEVTDEVYAAMRPGVIAKVDGGEYLRARFTVRPKIVRCVVRPPLGLWEVAAVEPMPLLV
jgi:hypothetical protein